MITENVFGHHLICRGGAWEQRRGQQLCDVQPFDASEGDATANSASREQATCWAEAHIKIARMTLTIKLDRNWNSFQLANSAPPLSVTDSAIAPSARINELGRQFL